MRTFSAISGAAIATLFLLFQLYVSVQISEGFSVQKSLLPELLNSAVVFSVLIARAIGLFIRKKLPLWLDRVALSYPIVLLASVSLVYFANDPLAGLPVIMLTFPYCLLLTLALILFKQH